MSTQATLLAMLTDLKEELKRDNNSEVLKRLQNVLQRAKELDMDKTEEYVSAKDCMQQSVRHRARKTIKGNVFVEMANMEDMELVDAAFSTLKDFEGAELGGWSKKMESTILFAIFHCAQTFRGRGLKSPEIWKGHKKATMLGPAENKEETMLRHSRLDLKDALTNVSSSEVRIAIQSFHSILGWMGDRPLPECGENTVEDIVTMAKTSPSLADEVYVQVMKQLTENPSERSVVLGWKVMLRLCQQVRPSAKLDEFVRTFVMQSTKSPNPEVEHMARQCVADLNINSAPEEVLAAEGDLIPVTVVLIDHSVRKVVFQHPKIDPRHAGMAAVETSLPCNGHSTCGFPGSGKMSSDLLEPEKKPVLPLIRRFLSEVNRRILQTPEELLSYQELRDFAEATIPSAEDSSKIVQLRQQLCTALHQYFRKRWPITKVDWSAEEMARGCDRPTGNRSFPPFQVDLSAAGVPYINAATVPGRVEEVSYVVTQHPLPSTVLHFWQMVLELQPTAIVMLNGHIHVDESQDGFALAPYWEPSAVVAPMELRVEETREDSASECNVRMLMCQRSEPLPRCWRGPQIVCPWWRDQSEPPMEGFLQLDRLLDSFLTPGKVHSVLVHCAGGIGRAGVFIAADAGARAAAQGKVDCSPDRLIGHLRRCRMNMVQTAEQYEFLHRALPVLTEQLRVRMPRSCTLRQLKERLGEQLRIGNVEEWGWRMLRNSKWALCVDLKSDPEIAPSDQLHRSLYQDFACFQMTDGLQTHRLLPDGTQLAMLEEKWAKLKAATQRASHLLFKRRFISFDETLNPGDLTHATLTYRQVVWDYLNYPVAEAAEDTVKHIAAAILHLELGTYCLDPSISKGHVARRYIEARRLDDPAILQQLVPQVSLRNRQYRMWSSKILDALDEIRSKRESLEASRLMKMSAVLEKANKMQLFGAHFWLGRQVEAVPAQDAPIPEAPSKNCPINRKAKKPGEFGARAVAEDLEYRKRPGVDLFGVRFVTADSQPGQSFSRGFLFNEETLERIYCCKAKGHIVQFMVKTVDPDDPKSGRVDQTITMSCPAAVDVAFCAFTVQDRSDVRSMAPGTVLLQGPGSLTLDEKVRWPRPID
eukprot:s2479_g3.t2